MKTKLQKLFLTLLTLAASSQKLGVNLIRVAILVIFVWIGGLKFWNYEAEGIVPFVANSPFMSFFYNKAAPEYKEYKLKEGEFNEVEHQWHMENNTYGFSHGSWNTDYGNRYPYFFGHILSSNWAGGSCAGGHYDTRYAFFPCYHPRSVGSRFGKWGAWFSFADRGGTSGDKGYRYSCRSSCGAGRQRKKGLEPVREIRL